MKTSLWGFYNRFDLEEKINNLKMGQSEDQRRKVGGKLTDPKRCMGHNKIYNICKWESQMRWEREGDIKIF